ncbi:MAG: polyprenyl synthetase family protein [Chloroflexota bacterium]
MSRPGRVLCATRSAKWPPLVLLPCDVLGGERSAGVIAASAVELAIAAGNIVDDVVDEEWDDDEVPAARGLNASLALLWLSQASLSDLSRSLGADRALMIGRLMSEGIVSACAGQDLDLSMERLSDVNEESAYDMTRWKSGSLAAMALQVGTAVATGDEEILSVASALGSHIGVVAQLLNDIQGVTTGSDLTRRKKTLPIAYALRCAHEENISLLLSWYSAGSPDSGVSEKAVASIIREVGGLDYAWVVAEANRREALLLVDRLAELTGRAEATALRGLVPSLERLRTQHQSR